MANSGYTTTSALADSKETIIAAARLQEEYPFPMGKLPELHSLERNTGMAFNEVNLSQLTAQSITEDTVLDNPQQLIDTLFSVEPIQVGIQLLITDQVMGKLSKKVVAKTGQLAQNAMDRKLDKDGIAMLDTGTSIGGSGTTLTVGHINAGVNRCLVGSGTDRPTGPIFVVLHPYQVADLQTEILAGLGTYTVPAGLTEDVYRRGFKGTIADANVYTDANITTDANTDAKGGVFSRDTLVLVKFKGLRTENRRRPEIGGGADEMFMYADYAFGVRLSSSLFEIYTNVTAPTS